MTLIIRMLLLLLTNFDACEYQRRRRPRGLVILMTAV